jgi:hypothetical protein
VKEELELDSTSESDDEFSSTFKAVSLAVPRESSRRLSIAWTAGKLEIRSITLSIMPLITKILFELSVFPRQSEPKLQYLSSTFCLVIYENWYYCEFMSRIGHHAAQS